MKIINNRAIVIAASILENSLENFLVPLKLYKPAKAKITKRIGMIPKRLIMKAFKSGLKSTGKYASRFKRI